MESVISKQLQTKEIAKYILDLTIPCHTFASVLPTVLAASSVYTARRVCGADLAWTAGLEHFSGYTEKDLIGCAKQMLRALVKAPEAKLQVLIFISAYHFLTPFIILILYSFKKKSEKGKSKRQIGFRWSIVLEGF